MKLERVKSGSSWEWRLDVTIAGRRYRETFTTKKAAEEFVVEVKSQARRRRHGLSMDRPEISLAELVAERIKDFDLTTRVGRRSKSDLDRFVAALPAGILLEEITRAHFGDYARRLRSAGVKKGSSINRYFASVSSMFKRAGVYFPELEEWRPPRIPWEKESKRGRERVIAPGESRALLEALRFPQGRVDGKLLGPKDVAARRDVADCFELMLLTGMRGGEVRSLEWSEVDLDAGEIHLPADKTKTREPRVAFLNSRAVEILRRRQKGSKDLSDSNVMDISRRRSRFIFPNEKGDGPRSEISRVIRPLARHLGLRYGSNLPDGFSPHSARHTATTNLLRSGVDYKTVQDIIGHTDKIMTLRYAHSTRESLRRGVESLARSTPTRQKVDKSK
jgi:integrase